MVSGSLRAVKSEEKDFKGTHFKAINDKSVPTYSNFTRFL